MHGPRARIALFLLLTFALSTIIWVPVIRSGDLAQGGGLYALALMWCPGIAAMLTTLLTQRSLRGMGWVPSRPKLLGLALVIPILYAIPVYLLAWNIGLGAFDPTGWIIDPSLKPLTGLLVILVAGAVTGTVAAAGEEIGWRGLLVLELAKISSFRATAMLSGIIWALWHLPLMIGANYHGGTTPIVYSVSCFAVTAVAVSFIMAWLTLRSQSFWPATLLHASHNLAVQNVLDPATVAGKWGNWWATEFGAGLALATTIAAWLLLRSGRPKVAGLMSVTRRKSAP